MFFVLLGRPTVFLRCILLVSKSFFFFVLFSIIFNRNVKIASKNCLFYLLSSDCGKINGFEMYRENSTGGRFGILGRANYPTPCGKTPDLRFFSNFNKSVRAQFF